MDFEAEGPPTSIISPAECNFSQVIFTNVQQFYKPNTDVQCKFRREQSFASNSKDWIGIFKVGWKTTREYFTWISARTSVDDTVLFTAYYLPKDDDYYQFCYVDYNGEVRGASIPVQFCHNIPEDDDDILMVTTEMEMMRTNQENAELKKVVEKLTEENTQLQEKVSSLQNETQAKAERIQNLQDELLSSTEKTQRLETENMERTVHTKNLEEETEIMKKTIQSLNTDLQMQRSHEEKLLSEMKEMERSNDIFQAQKKHFEDLQIRMKAIEEEKEMLESEKKLYIEKETKMLSERKELEKSLEKLMAEKNHSQSEDMARQKTVENLTSTANQCKEDTVKLKAELELQTCALEKEKKQKENLRQSLEKEGKRAVDLERNLEQKNEKLRSTEEKMTGLCKQVDVLKAENENKMKQMGALHMTIANLEGEVKRLKDECKSKMEAERTVSELRTQLKYAEEKKHGLERQLAQQQDICRQHGEEVLTLRSALELREEEINDLKDVHKNHRIEIDELHSHLLAREPTSHMASNPGLIFRNPYEGNYPSFSSEYGSSTSSTSRQPSRPLKCPVCGETFFTHQRQIFEDHVMCHLDGDEARP
ncbi:calcium-binding and coiled-coil domain-containing protein 2 [Bufo bufo]|uniref:calcium-binding and coiled-coil domain-containing protein 2 n=1 Tax=Bufo bufo TaxID=8384 RepID=UPI001ABE6D94|nr:calcium-binding and coiled-coil domain-containing protein 2 [Bufo bufo]XP_040291099.1 calcium-binding and coiled-coil domain-containing protein 2 [Bufo bufo]